MAISYVGKGGFAASSGAITLTIPSDYQNGDLLLMLITSPASPVNLQSGWSRYTTYYAQTGTSNSAGGVNIHVMYKVVTGTMSSVVFGGTGYFTAGIITCWRGVDTTTPIHAANTSVGNTTSVSCANPTTSIDNCMIVNCVGFDRDLSSTSWVDSWANASLASITEGHDQISNVSFGGGIGFAYGVKETAGSINNTTATQVSAYNYATISYALTPLAEAETYSESCSISQGSTIESTGVLVSNESCSVNQSSSVACTAIVIHQESSSISQPSTVQSTGHRITSEQCELSQGSTVEVVGHRITQGTNAISQPSTVESNVYRITFANHAISQDSTVNATDEVVTGSQTYFESCSVDISSSVQSDGHRITSSSCEVNQPSTVGTNLYRLTFGSLSVNQDSSVSSQGNMVFKIANSIAQSSTVTSDQKMICSVQNQINVLTELLSEAMMIAYAECFINQASRVHVGTNAPMSKKNRFNVAFVPKEVATVQASVNQGILVQYEKETEGDITMSSPHREEIKL